MTRYDEVPYRGGKMKTVLKNISYVVTNAKFSISIFIVMLLFSFGGYQLMKINLLKNAQNFGDNLARTYSLEQQSNFQFYSVLLSFGGRVSDPRYYAPELIYDVASRFRDLKLVLCHGGWPYVTAICKVAMDCPNVFLSPDTWAMTFAPGGAEYILAANYTLQDQIVFGSSYPAIPLEKAVENYVSRLRPEVADKIMYLNGARLFGLEA